MEQRDTFRDHAYWDATVHWFETKIAEYETILASGKFVRNPRLRLALYSDRLALLISQYSRGDSIVALRPMFPAIIDALAAYCGDLRSPRPPFDFGDIDEYLNALWLVALAVLLDIDQLDMERLVKLIDQDGKDILFGRLVSLRVSMLLRGNELLYPQPYRYLMQAIDQDGEDRVRLIRLFLKHYYREMHDASWFDGTHLLPGAGGFLGYWCFEVAAFVKMLDIPDQDFAHNPYYPRDLARP